MKSRTLFVVSLSVSIIIHALILFGPLSSAFQPSTQTERYRVTMVREPIRDISKDEAIDRQDPSTVQTEPIPDTEAVTNQAKNGKPPSAITDKAGPEHEREELRSADPQPQVQKDREPEERRAIETSNPGILVTGHSQEAELELRQEELTDYQRVLRDLRRIVQKSLRYPETARRKGIEGAVAVQFTLGTEGYAKDMVVSVSSGSRILDRAALQSISKIFPYPDPPEAPLHFTIPVTYRLNKQK
jgi:protein TonB